MKKQDETKPNQTKPKTITALCYSLNMPFGN